jgi:hypothetical protein
MNKKIDAADLGIDPDLIEGILGEEVASTARKRRPHHARQRATETFARIPHDKARKLFHHIGGPAWMLLVEIDRLILKGRGCNPVKLTSDALRGSGLTRWEKDRGLRLLERAGIVSVERRIGRCPLVTLLWYPIRT